MGEEKSLVEEDMLRDAAVGTMPEAVERTAVDSQRVFLE